jgi:GNAT superfamily N-acetyltransferase
MTTSDNLILNFEGITNEHIHMYASQIHAGVIRESNMMHPSIETIVNSVRDIENNFNTGRAVFYIDNETGEAVGYCRMIESIAQELVQQLGLNGLLPEIFELGTVFVNPAFRGRGLSTALVNGIAQLNLEAFRNRQKLLIGTTTSLTMLNSLRPVNRFGIQFYTGNTSAVDYIEAVTCMCNPDEPLGGTGTHISDSCSKRSTIFQKDELIPVHQAENVAGITADKNCKLFLSDLNVANRANNLLREACRAAGITRKEFSLLLRGEI